MKILDKEGLTYFWSKVKSIVPKTPDHWVGTQAEYDALTEDEKSTVIAFII